MSKVKNKVFVPSLKFEEMVEKYSGMSLSEESKVKDMVLFGKSMFAITAMYGNGKGGYDFLQGNRIELLKHYKGELKPLETAAYFRACDEGKRNRDGNGRIVWWGKTRAVLCEQYHFFDTGEKDEQLTIF